MEENFKIDFIGVGAPKTGTTWIAKCLAEHPQVCFSKSKEINFFNKENFFYIKGSILGKEWNYQKGPDWYKSHFDQCKKDSVKGEFSTFYLYDKDTPELIKKNFPDVKIIIILRNPADLFYSHYNHAASQWKMPPMEEAIKNKDGFIKYGFYSQYIEKYLKIFSKDKVLIMIYDDLKNNPELFIKKIYGFLGVDDNFKPDSLGEVINATAPKTSPEVRLFFSFRNKMIKYFGAWIVKHPSLARILLKIDAFFRDTIIKKISQRKKSYKNMPEEIRKKLVGIYLPEIERLENLLSLDLNNWKK